MYNVSLNYGAQLLYRLSYLNIVLKNINKIIYSKRYILIYKSYLKLILNLDLKNKQFKYTELIKA